jgi:Cu2+-containing amine oxidase
MSTLVSNRRLGDALAKRGLLPAHCRLIEASIDVTSAFVLRYEKLVSVDEMALFADALAEVAADIRADDERHAAARKRGGDTDA